MKSDYYRYLAEFATCDTKFKVAEGACDACVEANKIAENDLAVTHPIRLGMALTSSVFQSEVLQNPEDCDPDFAGDVHVGERPWCSCRGAETDLHGPDCSEDLGDSTDAGRG